MLMLQRVQRLWVSRVYVSNVPCPVQRWLRTHVDWCRILRSWSQNAKNHIEHYKTRLLLQLHGITPYAIYCTWLQLQCDIVEIHWCSRHYNPVHAGTWTCMDYMQIFDDIRPCASLRMWTFAPWDCRRCTLQIPRLIYALCCSRCVISIQFFHFFHFLPSLCILVPIWTDQTVLQSHCLMQIRTWTDAWMSSMSHH